MWKKATLCTVGGNGILLSQEKEGNPGTCDMDGPCGLYAEIKEREIEYFLIYMWNLKRPNSYK